MSEDIKRGDKVTIMRLQADRTYLPHHGLAKVLAVADGYAMVRFPRAMPFVIHLNDLILEEQGDLQ